MQQLIVDTSGTDTQQRAEAAWSAAASAASADGIAIVIADAAAIAAMLCAALLLPKACGARFALHPLSVSVLTPRKARGGAACARCINATAGASA